jgi:hypothetical protein
MADKYESVVMYGSWLEIARAKLPEPDVCRLMVQLMEYGLSGKVPDNSDNIVMDIIFDMAKPNIDSNIRKKVNGRKGGRKPGGQAGNQNAKKNEEKRITYGLSNDNVNGNANANANDNVNANGNANALPAVGGGCSGKDATTTALEGNSSDEWWKDEYTGE